MPPADSSDSRAPTEQSPRRGRLRTEKGNDRGGRSRIELHGERQEFAGGTLAQRRRPEVRSLLSHRFIASFTAKRSGKTLPDGADVRYRLGIVRNLAVKPEGEHAALELHLFAPLRAERDALFGDAIDRALCQELPPLAVALETTSQPCSDVTSLTQSARFLQLLPQKVACPYRQ